MEENIIDI